MSGGLFARLGWGRGPELPEDALVAVGADDERWAYGECAYVISVAATGPVRVHYSLTEPAGPTWLRLVEVGERRRRRVLAAGLTCGALAGAGSRGGQGEAAPHGWLHAAAAGWTVWTHLPADGRLDGVAMLDLVADLVPRGTWRELHVRRAEAWDAWARRPRAHSPGGHVSRTIRPSRTAGGDATRVEAVDQGPWDERVAGQRRSAEGWPGVRYGGGLGGAR